MNHLTQLQAQVVREIVLIARRESKKAGDACPSLFWQNSGWFRVRDVNRGYFLTRNAEDCIALLDPLSELPASRSICGLPRNASTSG